MPFRATVFREGHDQVGAMLVLTSPSGQVRHERMSPLAAGTDRWEAQALLDERGVWHWHVTGFDDEVATWRHDAALKIDAGVDAELMFEIGARLMDRAVAEKSRPLAARRRLTALAAGLRDDRGIRRRTSRARRRARPRRVHRVAPRAAHDRLARARDPRRAPTRGRRLLVRVLPALGGRPAPQGRHAGRAARSAPPRSASTGSPPWASTSSTSRRSTRSASRNRKGRNNTLDPGPNDPGSPWAIGAAVRRPRRRASRPRHARRLPRVRAPGGRARHRDRPRPRAAGLPRPPVGRRSIPTGSPSCPTAPSATPRTRRRSTRTSTRSTSTTIPRASSTRCCASCGTGSSRACGSSASTTRTRSP